MRYVALGKTGLTVSEVGFGGIPIIRLSPEEAATVVRHAHDRGITLYDTASAYLDSEEKLGRALEGIRDRVVLATKTGKRDREGVSADIDLSLRRLRTDYIDLFQLHQISQEAHWQAITAPDGALEALLRAREAGKVRHIGFSSHGVDMATRLAGEGPFSTVQFPFNFLEDAAARELHPAARKAGMGMIAMKPFCGGAVEDARVCFAFLRQSPDVIPIPGFDSVEKIDEVVALYGKENVVTPEILAKMDGYREELGAHFCRRCEYCQPCAQGVMITPAMMYPVIRHRMSEAKAVKFSAKVMESVRACIECGECHERCPYDLPIPELLGKYLAMYEEDLGRTAQAEPR